MSIENITAKILSEQTENTNAMMDDAKKKRDEIIKKASEKAAEIIEHSAKKANEDALILKERKISVAELDARKMYLGAKQQAVAKSFQEALKKLGNMEESAYIDFLVRRINEVAISGGEVVLNEKDQKAIGDKVIDLVNKANEARTVTLSKDTISGKGGFVLRHGSIEINATLEAIVNEAKETVTADVVKALFQ